MAADGVRGAALLSQFDYGDVQLLDGPLLDLPPEGWADHGHGRQRWRRDCRILLLRLEYSDCAGLSALHAGCGAAFEEAERELELMRQEGEAGNGSRVTSATSTKKAASNRGLFFLGGSASNFEVNLII